MKKTCKSCRYWTKNKKHGRYKCYTSNCPAKIRDLKVGTIITFEEVKRLKLKAALANGRVDRVFKTVSNKCKYKEIRINHRDEWYKCTHKDYHLAEYISITPCDKEYCPKLK